MTAAAGIIVNQGNDVIRVRNQALRHVPRRRRGAAPLQSGTPASETATNGPVIPGASRPVAAGGLGSAIGDNRNRMTIIQGASANYSP